MRLNGVGVCVYVCFNIEMAAEFNQNKSANNTTHTPRDLSLLMSTER